MAYRKEQFVFSGHRPLPAVIRLYKEEDFGGLIDIQRECFPPPFPEELLWSMEQLESHIRHYPEGALCAEVDGELAGSVTSLRIHFQEDDPDHCWEDVTGGGFIHTHAPDGNTLYVVDISVRPSFRRMQIGRLLLHSLYERVVADGMDRLLGGGRMSGYAACGHEAAPDEYIRQVLAGTRQDPVITFMLKSGRTPLRVVADYLEDEESADHAVLMEWRNPFRLTGG